MAWEGSLLARVSTPASRDATVSRRFGNADRGVSQSILHFISLEYFSLVVSFRDVFPFQECSLISDLHKCSRTPYGLQTLAQRIAPNNGNHSEQAVRKMCRWPHVLTT